MNLFPTKSQRDEWARPDAVEQDAWQALVAKKRKECEGLRDNIRQRIKDACLRGQSSCDCHFQESEFWPVLKQELEREGYKVSAVNGRRRWSATGSPYHDPFDRDYVVISWDEAIGDERECEIA